jgi:hypothetical protein
MRGDPLAELRLQVGRDRARRKDRGVVLELVRGGCGPSAASVVCRLGRVPKRPEKADRPFPLD